MGHQITLLEMIKEVEQELKNKKDADKIETNDSESTGGSDT